MGNYEQLKKAISDVIKTNGNQEITGAIMQNTLLSIISSVGSNATFAGVATPNTNPGTPDQNVFYLAYNPGIYVNFGGVKLIDEVLLFINNNQKWKVLNTGIVTAQKFPLTYKSFPANFSSRVASSGGFYFCEAFQNAIRANKITDLEVQVKFGDTLSVVKCTKPFTSDFSYSVIEKFNVKIGKNILHFTEPITLSDDEYLGVNDDTDNVQFEYYNGALLPGAKQATDYGFFFKDKSSYWLINTGYLGIKLWSKNMQLSLTEQKIAEVEEINDREKGLVTAFKPLRYLGAVESIPIKSGFFPSEKFQNIIRGKYVDGIYVEIATVGTLSLLKAKGVLTTDADVFKPTLYERFDIKKKGLQYLKFTEPMYLNYDEWLGISAETDTARFFYSLQNSGIEYIYIDRENNWTIAKRQDLSIGVVLTSAQEIIQDINNNLNLLKDKTISFLGDSITTFADYIPDGNETFYPRYGIDNVYKTWWKMLVDELGLKLIINQSWSGSRVTNVSNGTRKPFIDESRLGSLGNPDIIIVEGGINDFIQSSPSQLGEFILETNPSSYDKTLFRQAYQYLCSELQKKYPNSDIYICVPLQTNRGIFEKNSVGWSQLDLWKTIRSIADFYGIKLIDLTKCGINQYNINKYTGDGIHPNVNGAVLFKDYVKRTLINSYN